LPGSTTKENGATTTRAYDALSRVTSAVSSKSGSASETLTWTYDDMTAGSFGIGRLAATTFPSGSTTYAYERRGLLRSEQSTLSGASYATSYRYDANGNRTSIAYPSGSVATYTYDYANRPATLNTVTSGVNGTTSIWPVTFALYEPFGPLSGIVYGNGAVARWLHDSRYRVTRTLMVGADLHTVIADDNYTEDPAANITAIHDAVDATYNRDFTYDDLNRLVTANTGSSLWGTGSYTYDAMGNITSRSLGTAPVDDATILSNPRYRAVVKTTGVVDRIGFAYNSTTPALSVVTSNGVDHTVTYDAAGNETQYYVARTYSPRNLLATVTDSSREGTPHTLTYGYDARGVRVSRSESPTASGSANRYYFYSPELQLLAITDDDTANVWSSRRVSTMSAPLAASREFGYFNGIPVAEFGPARTTDTGVALSLQHRAKPAAVATTLYYTFTDHLGTPILQTDATATVVWRAEHEPYGNIWKMRTGSRTDQPLRLPGQDLAMTWEGAEENYNVFRWYRADWGRYTQGDPLRSSAVSPYEYVDDNPLNWIDSWGLSKHKPGGPYHPSLPTRCGPEDSCSQLYEKLGEIERTIESHKAWIKEHPEDTVHLGELDDWYNARNRCAMYIRKNCSSRSDCKVCKKVAVPSAISIGGYIVYKIIELCTVPELAPFTP
jgi:RHS repeat-associated protein